jgi:signal recognition particle subunit SRP72
MEKIDIGQTYAEIDLAIANEDHEKILTLSEKILKSDPKEKEAFSCKIISLINLSKNDEIISTIQNLSLQKEYILEYAYALHEKKKYNESITFLAEFSSRKDLLPSINELQAQNHYKVGNFSESYNIYKEIIENKIKSNAELEEEKDLLSNYLAAYVFSDAKDQNLLKQVMKHLNSWESFYNYSIICLKDGKFSESMETLYKMKKDFPTQGDDFNELKNLNLNLNLVQTVMEGFDYTKLTNIIEEYDRFFGGKNHNNNELMPYFYNNFLHIKKDRDSVNEILRKMDNFSKNENLFPHEKNILLINKIILLLRANRINDANELFKTLPVNYDDKNYVIIYCYILLKQEKIEKLEEVIKSDKNLNTKPEAHLILIQMILSSLTSKNTEQFHLKVLNFIKQFFDFTLNYHFLNFFIGFYEGRHLKDYLKEFVKNYKNPTKIATQVSNKEILKNCLLLLGRAFYTVGLYEDSVNFYNYILENIDRHDKSIVIESINSMAHIDSDRSESLRRQMDETMIDLSLEHINTLLSEVFTKVKKNPVGDKKKSTNKKKKKRFPKNFDPKKPGPMPDPERWLPKLQRKKYRNVAKNKMAYQGASADNNTTTGQFRK